ARPRASDGSHDPGAQHPAAGTRGPGRDRDRALRPSQPRASVDRHGGRPAAHCDQRMGGSATEFRDEVWIEARARAARDPGAGRRDGPRGGGPVMTMTNTVVERGALAPGTRPFPAKIGTKRARKHVPFAIMVLAAGVPAAAYAEHWWRVARFLESTDDAYVGGNVTAIAPHVAGFVAEIPAKDNQYVRAGELLIRLDDRDFRAAVDHAEAVLKQREAVLAELRAKYALQQSSLRQASAELAAKGARAIFASQDATRYQRLALTTFGSRQDAERA